MKKQAESWVTAAYDDLLVIIEILDNEDLTHMVAFHSQQAIEKSLKAVLEEEESEVLRTHNILVLREKVERYVNFKIDQEIFDEINELYIDSRYPTDLGLLPDGKPTIEVAKKFNEIANKIYKEIKNYLDNK